MLKLIRNMAGERYSLGISMSGISLSHSAPGRKARTSLLADQAFATQEHSSLDMLKKALVALLSDKNIRGSAISIILDDEWARAFFVTPPANASSKQDLVSAAKIRFETLYGDTCDDWLIEADYETDDIFLAFGMQKKVMTTINEVCDAYQLKVISISTHFLSVWNRYCQKLPKDSWLGLVNDQVLNLAIIEQQRLVGLRHIHISGHSEQWLKACLDREALRFKLSSPKQLMLVGNINGYWVTPDLQPHKLNKDMLICKNLDQANLPEQVTWSTQARIAMLGLPS